RQLQHIDGAAVHVVEAEDAQADVAADAGVAAGAGADVADEGRGGRLAVGAGDGDDLRPFVLGRGVHGAGEELDVAQDLDARSLGLLPRPVRLRVRQRHARREHQGGEPAPVGGGEVRQRQPCGFGGGAARRPVVPQRDLGAAGDQRARGGEARTGQAEHGDRPAFEATDRDHARAFPPYRSFKVARPSRASITAMIQKRITTVDSDHPSFSKWWWIGAMRNTRLPVSLNEVTWIITESVSSTKRPPITASTISCLVATATAPTAPPRASEPVSPMKILAGGALYQRKPRPAPIIAPQNTATSPTPGTKWTCR